VATQVPFHSLGAYRPAGGWNGGSGRFHDGPVPVRVWGSGGRRYLGLNAGRGHCTQPFGEEPARVGDFLIRTFAKECRVGRSGFGGREATVAFLLFLLIKIK
jgi:hypothetical protein